MYQGDIPSCALELAGLRPRVCYSFRVRAENAAGISEPSSVVSTRGSRSTKPGIEFEDVPPSNELRVIGDEIQYYVIGKQAKMEVLCVGGTRIDFSEWTREGIALTDERVYAKSDKLGYQTLTIANAQLDDAGPYTLSAQNQLGSATHTIYLEPADPPVFLEPLKDTNCAAHDAFTITCKVDGIPYPDVQFYKDWLPLAESSRIKIEQVDAETWRLSISNAIVKDSGLYSCRATNMAGSAITSAIVSVQEDTLNIGRTDLQRSFQSFKNRKFDDDYEVLEEICKRDAVNVYRVIERSSGKEFVAKVATDKCDLEKEKQILGNCFHPGIVELHAAYDSDDHHALVMEQVYGLDLPSYLRSLERFDENKLAEIVTQVLLIIDYLHNKNVAHLNLTPENILIEEMDNGDLRVRLIGFGNARNISGTMKNYCERGNPEFVSPEIVRKEAISLPSDMFSLGSIVYAMLIGDSPFHGENDQKTLQNIYQCNWRFNEVGTGLSRDARDFITKLLTRDIYNRLAVKKALAHPWIKFFNHRRSGESFDASVLETYCIRAEQKRQTTHHMAWKGNLFEKAADRSMPVLPSVKLLTPFELRARSESRRSMSRSERAVSTPARRYFWESENDWYVRDPGKCLLPITDTGLAVRLRGYRRYGFRGSTNDYYFAERIAYPNTVHERAWRPGDDLAILDRLGRRSVLSAPPPSCRELRSGSVRPFRTPPPSEWSVSEITVPDTSVPVFSRKLMNSAFMTNERFLLQCKVEGHPEPKCTWYHNNEIIESADRVAIASDSDGTQTLVISRALATDAGQYCCIAENPNGRAKSLCELVIGELPDKPSRPIVVDQTSNSVKIEWDAPVYLGNGEIRGYRCEYRIEGEVAWRDGSSSIDETCVVRDLQPSVEYRFRVCCLTAIGQSPYSTASEVTVLSSNNDDRRNLSAPDISEPIGSDDLLVAIESSGENPWSEYAFREEISRCGHWVKLRCERNSEIRTLITHIGDVSAILKVSSTVSADSVRQNIAVFAKHYSDSVQSTLVASTDLIECAGFICKRHKYREELVSKIISQLLEALVFLHERKIVHLNVNMGSLMLENRTHPHVRLCDLHLCRPPNTEFNAISMVDCIEYTAPELLNESIVGPSADIWSVGCVLYTLISGHLPFAGDDDEDVIQNVLNQQIDLGNIYENATHDAIGFVLQCLKPLPLERPSAYDCRYASIWLSSDLETSRNSSVFLTDRMLEFQQEFKIKRHAQADAQIDQALDQLSKKIET
ncbi:hypothetical protein ACOME3_005384 [Neoechinorhynchus agilis]